MDRNLKKALRCILESCGLDAVHKINDDYIESDKTKLCNQQWVKDIDLLDEDNDYVRMFVHLYRDNIDVYTEYDEGVAPSIDTVTLQLAFLGDVERLVVRRHTTLVLEAADEQRQQHIDELPSIPTSPFNPVMPDIPLTDRDLDLSDLPESTSTVISINNEDDLTDSGFDVKED